MQEAYAPTFKVVVENQSAVTVPLGMAVASATIYTDMLDDTPLKNFKVGSVSSFPHTIMLGKTVTRKLELPGDLGISEEFYHDIMEGKPLVKANVSI